MPNWCYNSATLHHDNKEVVDALEAELTKEDSQPLNHLRPNPKGEWEYDWSVSNWGTKWDVNPHAWERENDNTIRMHFDSAWAPPVTLYEYLQENGWSVVAYYHEPGMGFAGKYEDGNDEYYEFNYTDRGEVENLPDDILEFTNAMEDLENWEAEQEEEAMAELERTEWFPKKVKPVHVGKYEVMTKAWPYPSYCDWNGEKWQRWEGDDIKVTQWRGWVGEEWDSAEALDEMMKEFGFERVEEK